MASNKSTLWDLGRKRQSEINVNSEPASFKKDYRILERLSNHKDSDKNDVSINKEDAELLRNFLQNRQMTIGDLFTLNNIEGSKIATSLEKLVNFGLVRRDWDKEVVMHTDVVYSLTPEGHYVATKGM